jgi:uncharacterized membrane protein YcfT
MAFLQYFPILHGAALFLVVTSVQLCAFKQLASHLLELALDVLLPIESAFLQHGNIVLMRCTLVSLVQYLPMRCFDMMQLLWEESLHVGQTPTAGTQIASLTGRDCLVVEVLIVSAEHMQ